MTPVEESPHCSRTAGCNPSCVAFMPSARPHISTALARPPLNPVSEFCDALRDDDRTVWLVAQQIREAWLGTSEGIEAQLSLG